jgi:hypothetical protein
MQLLEIKEVHPKVGSVVRDKDLKFLDVENAITPMKNTWVISKVAQTGYRHRDYSLKKARVLVIAKPSRVPFIKISFVIVAGIISVFVYRHFTTGQISISYSPQEVARIEIDSREYKEGFLRLKKGEHKVTIKGTTDYNDTSFVVAVAGSGKKNIPIRLAPKAGKFSKGVQIILTEEDEMEIKEMIYKWKRAWERRNFSEYMSYYSPNFYADYKKMNYWQWREYKRRLFNKYSWMNVEIGPIHLQPIGNTVRAVFYQKFRSSGYNDEGTKLLILIKIMGEWKIIKEDCKENVYP